MDKGGGRTQCIRENIGVLSSDGKNQWPRPPSLAPLGQLTLRSPGDGSDERLRGAGAHSHLSPGPPLRGMPSCVLGQFQPAGKTKSDFPSCPGGTGPYNVEIWKHLRCTNTAWPGITVAGGDSIQKGNEVSHKAFLPTFFSKKVGYSRRSTRWTWTQRFLSVSMVKRQALILQGPSASS